MNRDELSPESWIAGDYVPGPEGNPGTLYVYRNGKGGKITLDPLSVKVEEDSEGQLLAVITGHIKGIYP